MSDSGDRRQDEQRERDEERDFYESAPPLLVIIDEVAGYPDDERKLRKRA